MTDARDSRRMCTGCGGCPAYGDSALCLFCEDGVPCDCSGKKKNVPLVAPKKTKTPKIRKVSAVSRAVSDMPAMGSRTQKDASTGECDGQTQPTAAEFKRQWSAAYVDLRMREHREWQEETTALLVRDFVNVAWVVFREMEARRHPHTEKFELGS